MNYVQAAMAGIFMYAGLVHLLRARDATPRLFSLLCFLASAYLVSDLLANLADTAAALVTTLRWRTACAIFFHVSLLVFVRAYTRAVPVGVIAVLSTGYALIFIVNGFRPNGIWFDGVPNLAQPAPAAGWLTVLWLLHLSTYVASLAACAVEYRRGQRREAVELGVSIGILTFAVSLILLEGRIIPYRGLLERFSLGEAGFLCLVLLTSYSLRRRSEAVNTQLRALVDHVPAYVFMKDMAGRYVFVNRYWLDQFQRTPEDSLGKTDLEIFQPEVARIYRSNDQRVFAEGKLLEFEETSSPHEGARTYSSLKFPIPGSGKAGRLLGGISTDVTDFMRLQRALSASESRLRSAMEAARIASWDLDYLTGEMVWSDNAHVIYGQPAKNFLTTMDAALNAIVPEDRARVMQRVEQALAHAGSGYLAEYRVARLDGEIRWIEARGRFEHSADGSVRHMLGTVIDISERKRAELAEHESQQRFRNLAAATFEGIAITENAVLVDMNEQLLEMFGYSREEVIGQPLTIGVAPDSLKKVNTMIESGSNEPYETTALHRDGSCFQIEVRARSFMLGDRNLRISAFRDITLQKQAEASLRLAQETELRIREEFAQHLLMAQEQERKRLANELHDGLGQSLSLIKNRASMALEVEQSATALAHLRSIVDVTITSIGELRGLVHSLRPVHIEQLGLTQSLRGLMEQTAQSTAIRLEYELEDVDDLFAGESSTHIYRIVQEGLSNLLKHSQATSGRICVERDIRCVRLRMTDDGQGFDVKGATPKGLGLTSIVERAHMLGGAFTLDSVPGHGTKIVIEFPLREIPADAVKDNLQA